MGNQRKRNPALPRMSTLSHPLPRPPPAEECVRCVCVNSWKLVMCEVCGETFRVWVSVTDCAFPSPCNFHVKECKWCKQSTRQEIDLPVGMDIIGKLRK